MMPGFKRYPTIAGYALQAGRSNYVTEKPRAVRRTFKMQDDQEDAPDLNTRQKAALTARVERLEAALLNIYQVWQIRSELFTNDEDCAASLADRARAAFGDATSHPPQQPEPQTGLSEG